jgi:hypothetical protein
MNFLISKIKIMKKQFLGFAACVSFSLCFAQNEAKKVSFHVGPQLSIAAADLAKTQSIGLGVSTQLAYQLKPRTALLGSVRYNHFLGKKIDGYVEPGSGMTYSGGKYKGMNEINITGGVRKNFSENIYGDAEGGICLGFSDGLSESSAFGLVAVGFILGNQSKYVQAIALFFGLCGDPKVHIGIRYSIRL